MERQYKGYTVHSDGRILKKRGSGFINPNTNQSGYHFFDAMENGVKFRFLVQRFVWEAFNGPILDDLTVDHIDANKTNNDISNLRLLTRVENTSIANRKYTDEDIATIKYLKANGSTFRSIAEEIGCNKSTVVRILAKKYYYTK
jgi:hypothetical protein